MQSSEDRSNKAEVEFSPDPLFSGIQMPVFDNLVTYFQQQYGDDFRQMPHRHDTAFIIVQHGFLNTGPILEALLYFGVNPKHVFISTKPHTTPTRMEVYLSEKFGQSYVPFWPDPDDKDQVNTGEYEALSRQACINLLDRVSESLFNPAEGNDAINNIVICDEGGRFLSEFIKLYNKPDLTHYSRKKFSDFNVVALEHTNCGTRSRELNHLRFPYIGMAKSLAKLEFESPLIVRAMFRALDQQLPKLISRGNKDFSVIGLGNIGKQVLSYLVKKYDGINIIAYDSDATKMLWVDGQKTKLGSQWIKVVRASNLREATRASSVILGCTGENIFNHFNVEEVIGETNKTHLFSCSSGQREFKFLLEKLGITFRNASDLTSYRYSKLHKITAKLDRSNNITRKAILAEDQLLFVHNAGFPINFSREESAGLLPEEAQLTCSLKLAAIVQALQLLQFLLSLRFHSDAKKWCEGFVQLALQKEILTWYAQNLPEGVVYSQNPSRVTQQEIESYSNDKSAVMPNFKELHAAYFSYFEKDLSLFDKAERACVIRNDQALLSYPSLRNAIGKITRVYDASLSHQQSALTYYLPTKTVEKVPSDISITQYTMKLAEKWRDYAGVVDGAYTLDGAMADYLSNNDKILLLLGEPGVGKSLFAWSQTKQLHHAQIHNVLGQRWLSIVIELKHYFLSQIKGLLANYLMNECGLSASELSALQGQGLNAGYRLLVILEGFGELKKEADPSVERQFSDCVKTCLENSGWNSLQVKIIVTCRLAHLENAEQEKRYFGHGEYQEYYSRTLLPFDQGEIETYLSRHMKARLHTKQTEFCLLLDQHLREVMQTQPLENLISNPLILRLTVDSLPETDLNENIYTHVKNKLASVKNRIGQQATMESQATFDSALATLHDLISKFFILNKWFISRKERQDLSEEVSETAIVTTDLSLKIITMFFLANTATRFNVNTASRQHIKNRLRDILSSFPEGSIKYQSAAWRLMEHQSQKKLDCSSLFNRVAVNTEDKGGDLLNYLVSKKDIFYLILRLNRDDLYTETRDNLSDELSRRARGIANVAIKIFAISFLAKTLVRKNVYHKEPVAIALWELISDTIKESANKNKITCLAQQYIGYHCLSACRHFPSNANMHDGSHRANSKPKSISKETLDESLRADIELSKRYFGIRFWGGDTGKTRLYTSCNTLGYQLEDVPQPTAIF